MVRSSQRRAGDTRDDPGFERTTSRQGPRRPTEPRNPRIVVRPLCLVGLACGPSETARTAAGPGMDAPSPACTQSYVARDGGLCCCRLPTEGDALPSIALLQRAHRPELERAPDAERKGRDRSAAADDLHSPLGPAPACCAPEAAPCLDDASVDPLERGRCVLRQEGLGQRYYRARCAAIRPAPWSAPSGLNPS
jgi:hypothetical protein